MGTNNPHSGKSTGSGSGRVRPRANAKRSVADNEQQRKARARILIEWLGGLNPPHPSRNIHQPGEYIDDLLKTVGVSDGVDEERLKEVWGNVAGAFVAQHTVPESINRGVLVLRVLQPAMKFHLQQMSAKLLENLHRELGKDTINKVVFKIG